MQASVGTSSQSSVPGASLVGASQPMRSVAARIPAVARARRTTLICGPTGTGKGVVAAALHDAAFPFGAPYVAVHCAAVPQDIVESELFGHMHAMFADASNARGGLVGSACGGTLFLDEVHALSLPVQAKLLRFIDSGEFRAVGSDRDERAEVWVLAATNGDLQRRLAEGTFREDLFYRLDAMRLDLPPLCRRDGDIELLAAHFLQLSGGAGRRFSADALTALRAHSWPGNVRELKHRIERAALLGSAEVIDAVDLGLSTPSAELACMPEPTGDIWDLIERQGLTLAEALDVCERRLISRALAAEGNNRTRAAARLGIHVRTIFKKLRD
jgi:DNA-binding NtrC family response regulator